MSSLYEHLMQDREFARLFAQESLIAEAGELIVRCMEEADLNKAQLANIVGTTQSHITQVLSGSRNMTLRTLADLMFAMNKKVRMNQISIEPEDVCDSQRWVISMPVSRCQQHWEEWDSTRPIPGSRVA